jgi:very-short-patch-repair endonuclease
MAGAKRLHRLHRGVYLIGSPEPSRHARCLGAVLACGNGALLSHRAAAWLWGLGPWPGPVDVTVPTRGHGHAGIALHHAPTISEEGESRFEGVPVAPVPRTLLDLAAVRGSRRRHLENRIDRAERRGLLDMIEIDAMLARRRGDPGTRKLRYALELHRDPVFNRAKSERLFLNLVKRAGLPRPAIDYFIGGYEVDAYWEQEQFAVEVDGWETHRTRRAFELDRIRQEDLKLSGIDSIRLAARRIEREPKAVGERLRRLLLQRRRELGSLP